ncbi:MAG: hypothetical protein WEB93_05750, partial [Sphingomonadales bacterium]
MASKQTRTRHFLPRVALGGLALAGLTALGVYGLHQNAGEDQDWMASTAISHWLTQSGTESGPSTGDEASGSETTSEPRTHAGSTADTANKTARGETVTFRDATLQDALRGAIEGDKIGNLALQSYMDAALGDEAALERRATMLLDALGSSPARGDMTAMAEAAGRISDAVATALCSAYHLPYAFDNTSGLPRSVRGWDFGPAGRSAPDNLIRISPDSREVGGAAISAFEIDPNDPLFGDGLQGVQTFSAPVEDGLYRVYLLSTNNSAATFGSGVRTNGHALRVVDAARAFKGAAIRFSGDGVMTVMHQDGDNFLMPVSNEASHQARHETNNKTALPEKGMLLATRAMVEGGSFSVAFDVEEGSETRIVGMIVELSSLEKFENDINQHMAGLFSNEEPASGTPVPGLQTGPQFQDSASHVPSFRSGFAASGRSGSGGGGGFGGGSSSGGLSGGGGG